MPRKTYRNETFDIQPIATSSPALRDNDFVMSYDYLTEFQRKVTNKIKQDSNSIIEKLDRMCECLKLSLAKHKDEIYYSDEEANYENLLELVKHLLNQGDTLSSTDDKNGKEESEDVEESKNGQKNKRKTVQKSTKSKMLPPGNANIPKTRVTRSRSIVSKSSKKLRSSSKSSCNTNSQMHPPSSGFQTPRGNPPNYSVATVTPGPNLNAPTAIFRKPNMNEVAISLSGSPLLVTSSLQGASDVPQITIPLDDGRVLAVLAKDGLRSENFPDVDKETVERLKLLYEFLGDNVLKNNW